MGISPFDILFELTQVYNSVAELLKDEDVATAKDIIEWLGFSAIPGAGLLAFLKWKRGRKIVKQEAKADGDGNTIYNITVEGDHNNVTVLTEPVYRLSQDARVRAAQRRTLAPLGNAGVNEFQVRQGRKPVVSIGKEEVRRGYYDLVPEEVGGEETIGDPQTFEAVLLLRSAVFVKDKKWQFYYGDQRISATLSDPEFVRRVFVAGERFGVGDRFRVRLCLSQLLLPNGKIRNDYEIVQVIETTPGPKQPDLNGLAPYFSEASDDDDPA